MSIQLSGIPHVSADARWTKRNRLRTFCTAATIALMGASATFAVANTPDIVLNGHTDLASPATYASGLPTASSDLTFTAITYAPSVFTLGTTGITLNTGTLDDLSTTGTLTIENGSPGSTTTLALNGGTNSVATGVAPTVTVTSGLASDLLYVATGQTVVVQNGVDAVDSANGTLNLSLKAVGGLDVVGTATFNSAVTDNGLGLNKRGTGGLTLANANNSVTGNLTLSGGTVTLTGLINGGSGNALFLDGGTLSFTRIAPSVQSFSNTSLAAGASAVTAAANNTVNLGAISRSAGGTIDFGATGTITTTTANTGSILGAWATVAGNGWAVSAGTGAAPGAVTALGAAGYTANTWAPNNNTDVVASSSQTSATTGTLRFNSATANTISLTGVNIVAGGGILVTNNATNGGTIAGAGSLSGSAGGELIINNAKALAITATIADNTSATALTKVGAGVLTLTTNNTYSGNTYVEAGSIVTGAFILTTPLGTGTVVLGGMDSGASVTFRLFNSTMNNPFTVNPGGLRIVGPNNGAISTFGGLFTLVGGATLNLQGFGGPVVASGGVSGTGNVLLDSDTGSRTGVVTISGPVNNAGLITSSLTASVNVISGTIGSNVQGIVVNHAQANAGLTLSGANVFTAPITVSNGTLKAGIASVASGSTYTSGPFGINSPVTIANVSTAGVSLQTFDTQVGSISGGGAAGGNISLGSATLIDGGDNTTTTYSGVISGSGNYTKIGTGARTLTNANTYSGNTTINAGTLYVTNASGSGTGTGPVAVVGGTLAGNGTLSGVVDVGSGAHIAPGVNNVGTLKTGGLTLESGSILDFNLNAAANSLITVAGSLTINGGGINLFQEGSTTPVNLNGNYTLITDASGIPSIAPLNVLNAPAGVTYTLGSTASTIFVTVSGGASAIPWAVDANGSFGTGSNWVGGIVPSGINFALFGPVITAPRTVTLDGDRQVAGVTFSGGNSYTLAQGSGGNLTLDNGAANATLADANGNHFVTVPVILNSSTVATVTNAGDTLSVSNTIKGAGGLTLTGLGTLLLTGTNSYAGTTIINGGTLKLGTGGTLGAANVTNNATLQVASGTPVTLSNNITGTGSISQTGAGTLTLAGTNSYTGNTSVNAGSMVQVGNSSALGAGNLVFVGGGTLDLHGFSASLNGISGTGTIDNLLAASNSTVALTTTGTQTFATNLKSTAGSLAFVLNGSGSLTLTGSNNYTGGTTINGGTISISSPSALGTGTVNVNTTTGLNFNTDMTFANNIVVGGSISGAEFFALPNNSNVTLSGNITSGSATAQDRFGSVGNVTVTGAASAIGILTRGNITVAGNGSLTNALGVLTIGRATTAQFSLAMTIKDNALVQGVGLNLDGLSDSSSDALVAISLSGNATLSGGTGTVNLNNSGIGSTVNLSLAGNSVLAGGAFVQTGSIQGATNLTFDGGTILANAGDTASPFFPALTGASTTTTILAGGLKINDGGFNVTIAQPFTNGNSGIDGGLTKLGAGSVTLTAANTFTGGAIVNSGSLIVSNTSGSGTGTGNVTLNGGRLGGVGSINGIVLAGSGPHTINPGSAAANSVGTLKIGGLVTNANTTLSFDLGSLDTGAAGSGNLPNGTSDLLSVAGNLTLNGGSLAISSHASLGNASLGYYKVVSYTGALTGTTSNIVLPAVDANNVAYTLDAVRDPGYIDVHRGYVGDATDDGVVDLNDLNIVLNNLGTTTNSWNRGNFDGAATIDLNDLNAVLNHLGTSIPSGASVVAVAEALAGAAAAPTPEPASLGVLALGSAGLLFRRRKSN